MTPAQIGGTALATAVLCVALVSAQSGPSSSRTTAVPRTADGRPDLQAVWNFSSLTPLERPAEFAGRPTISLAEAAQFEKTVMERNNADRRDGGVAADLARAQARPDHPADGPEDRSLAERCLGFNAGPPMLPGPYNNYMQLFQFKDHVVVFNEMIHDARVVPTDGRPHLPASVRRYLGDSVGRWEGNTLIVDTTNFTDRTNFRGASDRMHLVERFTRLDAETLLYEFTVDDPSSFTKPWGAAVPMKRTDEPMFEYACHEGNEAMVGILGGARYEDKNPAIKK